MFGFDIKFSDKFLRGVSTEFMLNKTAEFCFQLGTERYLSGVFKRVWSVYNEVKPRNPERAFRKIKSEDMQITKLLGEMKNSIKQHLFLYACCVDIYNEYSKGNEQFVIELDGKGSILTKIRKKYYRQMDEGRHQNQNLWDKGIENIWIFPFDVGDCKTAPRYFENFVSYFLVGLYSSKKGEPLVSPVEIYKNALVDETYNAYGIDKSKSDELINFTTHYYRLSKSMNFSIFDNYMYETEFNHAFTLDIISCIKKIPVEISEEKKELIEFTLSFLSLLPVYNKLPFIEFFLYMGLNRKDTFSKKWASRCIDMIMNLSVITIPLMEQTYYYLIMNEDLSNIKYKSAENPLTSGDWFLKHLNESFREDIEHIDLIQKTWVDDTKIKESYMRIQSKISCLKTIFANEVVKNLYRESENVFDAESQASSYDFMETKSYLDMDDILDNVKYILNGNLGNYYNNETSIDTTDKLKTAQWKLKKLKLNKYQIDASKRMSHYIHRYLRNSMKIEI